MVTALALATALAGAAKIEENKISESSQSLAVVLAAAVLRCADRAAEYDRFVAFRVFTNGQKFVDRTNSDPLTSASAFTSCDVLLDTANE